MKIIFLIISMFVIFIGALFKLQHWPNADITLITGLILFLICHAMVLLQIIREPEIRYGTRVLWLGLAVSLPYLGSFLFLAFHWGKRPQQA